MHVFVFLESFVLPGLAFMVVNICLDNSLGFTARFLTFCLGILAAIILSMFCEAHRGQSRER